MSKKTNYNSIVFLTTLSVYLGLVLVGGTAPVLAHSALTRAFDIKNEIEFKDDLDKKPDEDLFAQTLVELVRNLDALSASKNFDWQAKSIYTIEDLTFCESDNTPSYGGSGSGNRRLDRTFDEAGVEIGRKLLTKKSKAKLGEIFAGYSEGVTFKFSIENKSFNLETEINTKSGEIAKSFTALIDAYLLRINSSAKTTTQKIVAENTKSKVDDTKILLVTHLPRASIDELLAEKVAN
ncbi:MAG TPA: hypothetical protein VGC76_13955 [Pyrinomonadaceae bacterium]